MSNSEIDDLVKQKELDERRASLHKLVQEDPENAFNFLKGEPISVLVLRPVCKELAKRTDQNSKRFLELIEVEVKRVLSPDRLVSEYGSALALDFLVENWRRRFDENNLVSIEQTLTTMGDEIYKSLDEDDENLDNKVTLAIAKEFQKRVQQLKQHEERLFEKGWKHCEEDIEAFIDKAIEGTLSKKLDLFLSIGVLSSVNANALRRNMARVLFKKLEPAFSGFSEDEKFRLAPWLTALKLNGLTDEEQEKELAKSGDSKLKLEESTSGNLKAVSKKKKRKRT